MRGFAGCLHKMGFIPSKAKPGIWIQCNGDIYEYIAIYIDDLAITAKEPQVIMDSLQKEHGFKLNGMGPLEYHLDCSF